MPCVQRAGSPPQSQTYNPRNPEASGQCVQLQKTIRFRARGPLCSVRATLDGPCCCARRCSHAEVARLTEAQLRSPRRGVQISQDVPGAGLLLLQPPRIHRDATCAMPVPTLASMLYSPSSHGARWVYALQRPPSTFWILPAFMFALPAFLLIRKQCKRSGWAQPSRDYRWEHRCRPSVGDLPAGGGARGNCAPSVREASDCRARR